MNDERPPPESPEGEAGQGKGTGAEAESSLSKLRARYAAAPTRPEAPGPEPRPEGPGRALVGHFRQRGRWYLASILALLLLLGGLYLLRGTREAESEAPLSGREPLPPVEAAAPGQDAPGVDDTDLAGLGTEPDAVPPEGTVKEGESAADRLRAVLDRGLARESEEEDPDEAAEGLPAARADEEADERQEVPPIAPTGPSTRSSGLRARLSEALGGEAGAGSGATEVDTSPLPSSQGSPAVGDEGDGSGGGRARSFLQFMRRALAGRGAGDETSTSSDTETQSEATSAEGQSRKSGNRRGCRCS